MVKTHMNVWRLPVCCSAMNHPPTGKGSSRKDNRLSCWSGQVFLTSGMGRGGSGGGREVAVAKLLQRVHRLPQTRLQVGGYSLAQRLTIRPLENVGTNAGTWVLPHFGAQAAAEDAPAGAMHRRRSNHETTAVKQRGRQQPCSFLYRIHKCTTASPRPLLPEEMFR